MHIGSGTTLASPNCETLSLFVQGIWLKDRPLVHSLPSWLDGGCKGKTWRSVEEYYRSRLAFFFSTWSTQSDSAYEEKAVAYETAESIASRLREAEMNDALEDEDSKSIFKDDDLRNSKGLPLPKYTQRSMEPTWLLSSNDLKKSPPNLKYDTLSIHILNQGFGPASIITFREIDDEGNTDAKRNLEQKSRTGVIGRILSGMRRKIFDVVCHGGNALVAGELDDSPAALAFDMVRFFIFFSFLFFLK